MYSTPTYKPVTENPLNKEKRDKFVKYHDVINGYFTRLIREDYKFDYNINLRFDDTEYTEFISAIFISSGTGEIEIYFNNWIDKLTIRDYRRHKELSFNDAESLIAYFKEVYFPILDAENTVDNLKGEIND